MATINLGSIKFNWKGTYAGGTAYVVDDVVSYNGSSYICKLASTGNLPTNGTYWDVMAEGGDVATTLTTQGDVLYRDGSGLQRLAKGTAGQALIMNTAANAPEWGTISSGEYSVHKIDAYSNGTQVTGSGQSDYHDIAGGNYLSFTPTSTNDYVHFSGFSVVYDGSSASGGAIYTMLGTSTTIGSGDTKIGYTGTHSNYNGNTSDFYRVLQHNFMYKCTGLTPSTTYYVELAGGTHNSGNNTLFNHQAANATSDGKSRYQLVHYKKN